MEFTLEITEADKELWRRIKRNGHFRKRKADLLNAVIREKVPRSDYLEESVHTPQASDGNSNDNNPINDHGSLFGEVYPGDNETDESEEEADSDPQEFCDDIRKWAIEFQIKHTALNALLLILKGNMPNNVLPKCARTLVHTPRSTIISSDERLGGQYWHYGLKKVLVDHLSKIPNIPEELSLNINIDGLPAFNSSTSSFWPILVNIFELKDVLTPLIVGVFCGGSMSVCLMYKIIQFNK